MTSHKVLIIGVFLLGVISLACGFGIPGNGQRNHEDKIFVRGKWFNKNGKSSVPEISDSKQATPPQIFQQCMDHSKPDGCQSTWDQRYWVKRSHYKPGGPVFFMFGGEGPADRMVDVYYWQNYASQYGALLIVLEHRFYGESYPTYNSSLENLQLLTSQQALADAAYFIEVYSEQNNLVEPWVAFGGSYAGNLAAWMKQKYPNHVKLAVSSSGPLEAVYDFPGYMETVSEVVKAVDTDCYDKVYAAFECMESLVNGSSCGTYTSASQIPSALNLCWAPDFQDRLDRETFFNILAMDTWADNWPSAVALQNCDFLKTINGNDPLSVYGEFLVATGDGECKTRRSEMSQLSNFIRSEEGRQSGAAGWYWQTCYEFGYYMSSDPKNGLFGYNTFSGDPYGVGCSGEYGPQFTTDYIRNKIDETNEYYQGKDIDSKCVIFVNGQWDPWHTLGINDASETTSSNTVVNVPRAEHCDDMLDPDSPAMREAQTLIANQIGSYLSNPNC